MRTLLLALLPLLIAAAGEPPRPVRVTTVAIASVPSTLVFSGSVQARTQADLGFRVAGKVVSRPVELGDRVQAGQVMAQLDEADLRLSEQAAEAALQAAIADATNARADFSRYERLGNASSAFLPSEFDKRAATTRMADARVVQAERQLALARSQRSYGVLTADADGIVTALPVQVGQVVAAGQTVATLAHASETEVVADVPENRLEAVRTAGAAEVALWAAPGRVLHGRLREIGGLADPASRTFAVKVRLDDAPPGLMALGMTATVSFGHPSPPLARLPATALTDRDGKPAMWVLDPAAQRASLRPVTLGGFAADGSVLVLEGLRSGESVVTAGVGQIDAAMALIAWPGAAR